MLIYLTVYLIIMFSVHPICFQHHVLKGPSSKHVIARVWPLEMCSDVLLKTIMMISQYWVHKVMTLYYKASSQYQTWSWPRSYCASRSQWVNSLTPGNQWKIAIRQESCLLLMMFIEMLIIQMTWGIILSCCTCSLLLKMNVPLVSGNFNSLAQGKFEWNFWYVTSKQILGTDSWGVPFEIAQIWMSLHFPYDQSTVV